MEFVETLIMGMKQKGLSEFTCKLPSDDISSHRPEAVQMPLSEFRQKVEALRAKILKTAPMLTVVNIQDLLELEYGILQIGDACIPNL